MRRGAPASLAALERAERELAASLRELRAQLTSARLRDRVERVVAEHDGLTGNAVQLAVKGQRAAVLQALRELQDAGRVVLAPARSRMRVEWFRAPGTGSATGTFDGEPVRVSRRLGRR